MKGKNKRKREQQKKEVAPVQSNPSNFLTNAYPQTLYNSSDICQEKINKKIEKNLNKFSKYSFARPITNNKKFFYSPYQSEAYTNWDNATSAEILIKQAGLLCCDLDIKENDAFERDYTFEQICDLVDLSKTYIEYSQNRGLHIYWKAEEVLEKKEVFETATGKLIEFLDYRVSCTNNTHKKCEFEDFTDFYENAEPLTIEEQHRIFVIFNEIFENKRKKYTRIKENNNPVTTDITIDDRKIKYYNNFIVKNIGVKAFLDFLQIDIKEYNKYYTFFSLLEDDGRKHGAMVYKVSGIVRDFHTGETYAFLQYFQHHIFFSEFDTIDATIKNICEKVGVGFVEYQDNLALVVEPEYKTIEEKTEYIQDKTIQNIINRNKGKTIQIKAQTGTGKTTGLLNYALHSKEKFIFLFPYQLQVMQLQEKFEQLIETERAKTKFGTPDWFASGKIYQDICYLYEGMQFSDTRIVITTYDSLFKIPTIENYDFVIIDEYHNFLLQKDFRQRAIENVVEKIKEYNKTIIKITATPQCVFEQNNDTIISYNILTQKTKNYEKMYYVEDYKDEQRLGFIIKHHHKEKVDIVYINDVTKMLIIKKELEKKGLKVGLLYSRHNANTNSIEYEGNIFTEITKTQTIPNGFDIILTTIVLSDGINVLNNNIGNVYFYSYMTIVQIQQSIARYRNGCQNIFVFVKEQTKQEQGLNFFKVYEQIHKQTKEYTEKLAKTIYTEDYAIHKTFIAVFEQTNYRKFAKTFDVNRYTKIYLIEKKIEIDTEDIKKDIYAIYCRLTRKTLKIVFTNIEKYEDERKGIGVDIKKLTKELKQKIRDKVKEFIKKNLYVLHKLAKEKAGEKETYDYKNITRREELQVNEDELKELRAETNLFERVLGRYMFIMKYIDFDDFYNNYEYFETYLFAGNSAWKKFSNALRATFILKTKQIYSDIEKPQHFEKLFTIANNIEKAIEIIGENKHLHKNDTVKILQKETILSINFIDSIIQSKIYKVNGKVIRGVEVNLITFVSDVNVVNKIKIMENRVDFRIKMQEQKEFEQQRIPEGNGLENLNLKEFFI
ncbi:MAG: DEAD/DEAH box helicase family protein [Candidatus Woesearchaeota archaeon]